MIRAIAFGPGGRKTLVFGISEGNVVHLKAGRPMHISLDDMGLPMDIMIFYGKTEAELVEMMKPLIDKETIVHDQRQEKKQ